MRKSRAQHLNILNWYLSFKHVIPNRWFSCQHKSRQNKQTRPSHYPTHCPKPLQGITGDECLLCTTITRLHCTRTSSPPTHGCRTTPTTHTTHRFLDSLPGRRAGLVASNWQVHTTPPYEARSRGPTWKLKSMRHDVTVLTRTCLAGYCTLPPLPALHDWFQHK